MSKLQDTYQEASSMNSVWTDRYPSEYGWALYGTEQTQNASEIASYLIGTKGVNVTSAYAILGNLTTESFLNPAQWFSNFSGL